CELGNMAWRQGDADRAAALIDESLIVSDDSGDVQAYALALGVRAQLARDADDLDRATELYQERLRLYWGLDEKWGIMRTLHFLAVIAVTRKQPESAIQMFAAVASLRETTGIMSAPIGQPFFDNAPPELVGMVGEAAFQTAWEQARTLPVDAGIREALKSEPVAPQPPASSYPDRLTAREVEVLRMIATGGSNSEIAEALFLSPRTVERHIANIYLKIDVHNKVEATAYALRQQLA
ncbi:MAG: LuxR C-terminal-related transcriptional regulator, partial [Chloroflexota bacterium]|nr:LuxR C-terminal-related transcriptional regulator [Chloroflexota bacterium]